MELLVVGWKDGNGFTFFLSINNSSSPAKPHYSISKSSHLRELYCEISTNRFQKAPILGDASARFSTSQLKKVPILGDAAARFSTNRFQKVPGISYSTLENLTDDFAFLDTCNAEIGIGTAQMHLVYTVLLALHCSPLCILYWSLSLARSCQPPVVPYWWQGKVHLFIAT
jgi:hypothetical protein